MPNYKTKFGAPKFIEQEILNKEDGSVFGTIKLKPSTVHWKPKGQKTYSFSISYETLDKWMKQGYGKSVKF